jgi:hypothetical protein
LALLNSDRALTFAEICLLGRFVEGDTFQAFMPALRPGQVRSLRRALQKMVADDAVLALGQGGPAEPHRYSLNPMVFALAGNKEGYEAAATKADAVIGSTK